MRLLLDTHVFIWWCTGDRRLRAQARKAIHEAGDVLVSAVIGWEIAVKVALGKLQFPTTVAEARRLTGFSELPISIAHADAYRDLPAHHSDPFDRLLIAQAVTERLTLVTADRALAPYQADFMWT